MAKFEVYNFLASKLKHFEIEIYFSPYIIMPLP